MTDAIMVLERCLNFARQCRMSPLLILAWQSDSRPETARKPLPPGHVEAFRAVQQAAGGSVFTWWSRAARTKEDVAKLFEEALFTLQMDGL